MARQGKFSRLPHELREKVNVRLLDGEPAATLLEWLNKQPAARKTWDTYFNGDAATPQNLSAWRDGGYTEWLSRRERAENLRTLQAFALDLAKSGGSIADGAAAIIGGRILVALEDATEAAGGGAVGEGDDGDASESLARMAGAVAQLQKGEAARAKAELAKLQHELNKERVAQSAEELKLSREKFEWQFTRLLLDKATSAEVQAIATSREPDTVKLEKLHELLFGTAPGKGDAHA